MNWLKIKKILARNWPPMLIFLMVVVFFWKFIFKGLLPLPSDTIVGLYHPWRDLYAKDYPRGIPFKNFLLTDPVRQQFLWRKLAIEAFKKRQLPGWNPHSFTGTPLLANFQSAPFYIFNFLFFFLDFPLAWGILIFFQPFLAGIFLYFYLRELKLASLACLFGALSFSFGGFFIAWLEWGTILHSALWLPLILLAIEKLCRRRKLFLWSFVFVFSLIQSFFAGHLQTFFYVIVFSGIYLVWKLAQVKNNKSKLIFFLFISYLFFGLITSFQWRPTLQFIKLSAREVDQADWQRSGWFVPGKHLVQFLAPDFFGNPATLNYWGEWNYGEFIGYIGVLPLIFSLGAIFFLRTRNSLFFTLCFIFFLSFALPTPWAKLPYMLKTPFISTAQPTRMMFLVSFCLAILAALGLNEFFGKKRNLRFLILPAFLYSLLWFFVLAVPKIWPQLEWVSNLAISRRNLILPSGLLAIGIILIGLFRFKKIPSRIIFSLCLLVSCFDLFRFGWKFTPFTKKDWLFPSTKAIEFLKSDQEVFRVMAVDRRIFPPNFASVYQLQAVSGYDPLYLRRYGELIAALERGEPNIAPPFGFNRIITPQNWWSPLIDLLNVKYALSLNDLDSPKLELVFQEGETRVYQNKTVFPRAFLVYSYREAKNKNEAIALLFEPKIDLRRTAVLEEKIDLDPTDQPLESQVKIVEYQPHLVKLEVISSRSGILVLTDAFYPGWKAEVNGEETKIYRANYHFRAIIMPAGKHQVSFEYKFPYE